MAHKIAINRQGLSLPYVPQWMKRINEVHKPTEAGKLKLLKKVVYKVLACECRTILRCEACPTVLNLCLSPMGGGGGGEKGTPYKKDRGAHCTFKKAISVPLRVFSLNVLSTSFCGAF